ncbi:uncharacterized protein RHOBADRAFT_54658 [Rhodotorula graminis WP1]|uniref:DNA ligase D 3'-phosphoesterase domain-containing protein n=1 Tax=Rhodotorula graminis (strain WP1) TaxID=578459 RepID=A0A0P9IW92_RHOGW|nr:uncharacterized protein RHOBADRAFT_54658 [Rhodotorula graminis WP1]KPV74097.1 hypothetical protein RHOBADRAFT_54658 [Rhodotorula graminis WP1]
MGDLRLKLRDKTRPLTPAEYRASHFPRRPRPPRSSPTRARAPAPDRDDDLQGPPAKRAKYEPLRQPGRTDFHGPDPALKARQRTFAARDFATPWATEQQIDDWLDKYPALRKRNFFIVQDHRATSWHHDLRLQLDGVTVSWAIPRGLHDPDRGHRRLAVETQPHSIAWSLWEGPTVHSVDKPTGVWDIGTYTIHETKAAIKRRAPTSTSTIYAEETPTSQLSEDEDELQETRFRNAYHAAAGLATPAAPGAPGLPVDDVSGRKRGFVVELNGERWRGLKLHFVHDPYDFKISRSREAGNALIRAAQWFFTFSSADASIHLRDTESSTLDRTRSLLTDRTLDEIRDDSIVLLDAAGARRGPTRRAYDPETFRRFRRFRERDAVAVEEEVEDEMTQAQWDEFSQADGGDEGRASSRGRRRVRS